MDRVFYTNDGKLYKAEAPKDMSHAEMNFPTQDILKALTADPVTREIMIGRINHPDFGITVAVLAADEGVKK